MWAVLFAPLVGQAETSLNVSVSPKRIEIGQTVTVNVQVAIQGQSNNQGSLEAPSLLDWTVVGQFKRTTYDSSRQQKITILDLQLQPSKTGQLKISPFSLKVGQKRYKSESVIVTVTQAGGQTGSPPSGGQSSTTNPSDDSAPTGGAPDEYAFLTWEIDRSAVWLGEPIQAQLYIHYRQGLRVSRLDPGKIDLSGFWNEESKGESGRAQRVQIGEYAFIKDSIAQYTLYPMRSGQLSLPPIEAQIELSSGGFFRRGRAQTINRAAPKLDIEVRPLPKAGRPKNYRGIVVGKTRLRGRIDRRRIKATEGVELSVELRMEGLIANVPEFKLPDSPTYRVFPSPTKTQSIQRGQRKINIRKQVWLVRPNQAGKMVIPSLKLAYFDPGTGRYKTARTQQYTVQVTGQSQPKMGDGSTDGSSRKEIKLHSIRDSIDLDVAASGSRTPTWFMSVVAGTPAVFMLMLLLGMVRKHRFATADERAAKNAGSAAKQRLAQISKSKDLADGYRKTHSIVVDFVSQRFQVNIKGKTFDQITTLLMKTGVSKATARGLTEQMEAIEFARFARAGDAGDLQQTVQRVNELISQMEAEGQ
ncbi:MAG: BatD family protein [Myxococcota bacterium]|nr:BatD family protein [Myxococcota bacterium]